MADQDELRQRTDADGISLPDAIAAHGVDLDRAVEARRQLENAAAYLECTSSKARCWRAWISRSESYSAPSASSATW